MTATGQLSVIRKWFEQMGGTVADVPLDLSIGRNLPSLGIVFGAFKFNAVEDPGGAIILLMSIKFGDDVRKLANDIGKNAQHKMFVLMKEILTQNPRIGWNLIPPTVASIEQLTETQLAVRLRVNEDDLSTFNRFADAVQELITAQVRLRELFSNTLGTIPPVPKAKADREMDSDASRPYR